MAGLLLKSGNALSAQIESLDFITYKNRVIADGGFIADEQAVKDVFRFMSSNSITAAEVFSATSARWGVKLANGKPSKFYSLFSNSGDISPNIRPSDISKIDYNTTRYSTPVLELKGSVYNYNTTEGSANNVLTSGLCIIAKVPTGGTYGTGSSFGLGGLAELTASDTTVISGKKRVHDLFYKRVAITDLPDTWGYLALGHGAKSEINSTSATYPLRDATKWSHVTTFLSPSALSVYNDGALLATVASTEDPNYRDNLSFVLGAIKTSQTVVNYSSGLYGDISEAWCLVNTTAAKMQLLSQRASQKYTN